MDELTARQRLTRILQEDVADDDMTEDVSAVVEDNLAAIRSKSGGTWDRLVAAEYIADLEQTIADERKALEEEEYDEEL